MIVFDLCCAAGHVFEAWFASSEDYEAQRAKGLVSCPVCGEIEVDKAVMAPRVAAKGNQRADAKAAYEALARAQAEALKESHWVGEGFAGEARAIHLGEAEARAIHGQASIAEARALHEEGIAVMPLPLPVRPPRTDN